MKSFLEISDMVEEQGYGKFLSRLLVEKALEVKIKEPTTLVEYLTVEFDLTNT